MNGFFQSLKTCGALLARVGAALGEVCRRIVVVESAVVRAFTSTKARDEGLSTAPVVAEAPAPLSPDPVATAAAETNENLHGSGLPEATMTVSGPACRMAVEFGYVPPALGVSVLLREMERV